MFLDHAITLAGRTITITAHDLLMTGISIVAGLVCWTALYFSRKWIVVVKRSSAVDQLTYELSRIADALERVAKRPADRASPAPTRQQQLQPPAERESNGVAFSMFGR